MGTWGKCTFGGKGYPKCSKRMPQVPCPHSLQMFTYGHWGKWTFGANKHLEERGIPSAPKGYHKCPVPIFPKFLQMGTGANGRLGQMCSWGK